MKICKNFTDKIKFYWKSINNQYNEYNYNKKNNKDGRIKVSQSMLEKFFHVIFVLLYILLNLLTPFYGNSVFNNKKYDKLTAILIVISILIIILWHAN